MSEYFDYNAIQDMYYQIQQLYRITTEQALADAVQRYDFIVGSQEVRLKLIQVLPKEARIVYSPYITESNMIHAVAHIDMANLLQEKSKAHECPEKKPKTLYISIDHVMSVFDDFMCGEVDEDGMNTFLEMLKDKAESEDKTC